MDKTDFQHESPRNEKTIDDVQQFWDATPLWVGETSFAPGTLDFFEEHRTTVIDDCFAGQMDETIFPDRSKDLKILDLGCGIGFWLVEFAKRRYTDINAADLSSNSLKLARERCKAYEISVNFSQQNAESTSFDDATFDHVNCQGVVHHTPSPENAMREIERILKPNGTASVSVYYKNIVLRNWKTFRGVSKLLSRLGAGLRGRGREGIYANSDIDDIVRQYDGADNPIGIAYDKEEFLKLIGDGFAVDDVYFHFFPARSMPVGMPRSIHKLLDRKLPFMIYANLRKI